MGVRDKLYAPTYMDKVLEIQSPNLLAYWPLNEKSGNVAHDRSGHDRHGAYTGVTLGQPGIGDGNHCPLFDGINDFVNIYSVSLRDAFNGAEGTVMVWFKVFDAGVWEDSTTRDLFALEVDGDNHVFVRRQSSNGALLAAYEANNTRESFQSESHAETTWLNYVITWSKSSGGDGEAKGFIDGVQDGATETTLGVWAGALGAASTVIGAVSTVPAACWHGYLAHCAIWDTPLTPAQIAQLAVI